MVSLSTLSHSLLSYLRPDFSFVRSLPVWQPSFPSGLHAAGGMSQLCLRGDALRDALCAARRAAGPGAGPSAASAARSASPPASTDRASFGSLEREQLCLKWAGCSWLAQEMGSVGVMCSCGT